MREGRGEGAPPPSPAAGETKPSRREELAFAGIILAYCLAYVVQVAELPLHSIAYPLILIAGLVALGGLIAVRAAMHAPAAVALGPGVLRGALRAAVLAVTAFVFPFAATGLGFAAAIALATAVVVRLVSGLGTLASLATGLVAGLLVTLFLADILGLSVPRFPFLALPLGF